MSESIVQKVPHVHAEVIRQWANDQLIKIQWRRDSEWRDCNDIPNWDRINEYRIKPAPSSKIYPTTGMTGEELLQAFNLEAGSIRESFVASANTALRHAIDAGEILTLADHQAAIAEFGEKLRDAASSRDMAIAQAVRMECARIVNFTGDFPGTCLRRTNDIDLAAIIAKVPTC